MDPDSQPYNTVFLIDTRQSQFYVNYTTYFCIQKLLIVSIAPQDYFHMTFAKLFAFFSLENSRHYVRIFDLRFREATSG